MKKMAAIILAFILLPSLASAGEFSVWVLALEPDDRQPVGTPCVYKVDIESATVVRKMMLDVPGAPVFCHSQEDGKLLLVLLQGVAANGTEPGEEKWVELLFDPLSETTEVIHRKAKERSMNDYRAMVNNPLSGIASKPLDDKTGLLLARADEGKRDYLLKDFSATSKSFSVAIMEDKTESRSVDVDLNDLPGFFFGAEWGDCRMIGERYLVMLLSGAAPLGRWSPGHVVIVDTQEGVSRIVAVGSNPARGTGESANGHE